MTAVRTGESTSPPVNVNAAVEIAATIAAAARVAVRTTARDEERHSATLPDKNRWSRPSRSAPAAPDRARHGQRSRRGAQRAPHRSQCVADPSCRRRRADARAHRSAVENELYQTRLQPNQDPLNFPIKLNNKIATLRSVIDSIDSKPTDQSHDVFDLLEGQLIDQLDQLAEIVADDVPAFNAVLASHGQPPITCSAVSQSGTTAAAPQRAQDATAGRVARAKVGRHVG
jgi:hypothetical protein